MGKCKGCNKLIDDKYSLCVECNIKSKQANSQDELIKIFTKMNWNLGRICLCLEMICLDEKKLVKARETMEKIMEEIKKNDGI